MFQHYNRKEIYDDDRDTYRYLMFAYPKMTQKANEALVGAPVDQ